MERESGRVCNLVRDKDGMQYLADIVLESGICMECRCRHVPSARAIQTTKVVKSRDHRCSNNPTKTGNQVRRHSGDRLGDTRQQECVSHDETVGNDATTVSKRTCKSG